MPYRMKLIVFVLLVTVTLAQAERNWDEIFPINVLNPPHALLPRGIPSPRITGGQEAGRNSYPYQMLLSEGVYIGIQRVSLELTWYSGCHCIYTMLLITWRFLSSAYNMIAILEVALFIPLVGGTGLCGGSLLSSRTILTAAHCVASVVGPIEVLLGAHNVRIQEQTQVNMQSSFFVIHPQWSQQSNDIALIILPQAVIFSDAIRPISLPRDDSDTYEGREATVSGWGQPSDSAQTISDVLRYVKVPIISNDYCSSLYPGHIKDTNICASGESGKSTCSGDSGGALVVGTEQVGIVSFGNALGCEIGWPSAYTRVSKYLSFISENTV